MVECGLNRKMGGVGLVNSERYLRNRSALAVNCCIIIYCFEVSCKEDQNTSAQLELFCTTDRQTVNYYSKIHGLELINFNSNTN